MKAKTSATRHSMNRSPLRRGSLLIALVLPPLAVSLRARAVCQDACLTNFSTVQSHNALLNNIGTNNTAIGFNALLQNTSGSGNTAAGAYVLLSNTTGSGNTATGGDALTSNTTDDDNTAIGSSSFLPTEPVVVTRQ